MILAWRRSSGCRGRHQAEDADRRAPAGWHAPVEGSRSWWLPRRPERLTVERLRRSFPGVWRARGGRPEGGRRHGGRAAAEYRTVARKEYTDRGMPGLCRLGQIGVQRPVLVSFRSWTSRPVQYRIAGIPVPCRQGLAALDGASGAELDLPASVTILVLAAMP